MRIAGVLALLALVSSAQQAPPLADHFFDSGGVRIRYVEQGQGAPVVLIHGFTGSLDRHFVSNGVFAHLAKDHRVIAFDCRGHGKSGKPHDPKAYGNQMAQDIVRLLDHLNIARAHIVGFSLGALITGHLLTTHPERFLTATFVGHHPSRRWTAEEAAQAEALAQDLEGEAPFRSLIIALSPPGQRPSEDEIRKTAQGLVATNDVKALAAVQRGYQTLSVTSAQLANVRVPLLEIIGSEDHNIADMRELKKEVPQLRVVVVDGATHGGERGILRRPEFLSTLREFLAAQR